MTCSWKYIDVMMKRFHFTVSKLSNHELLRVCVSFVGLDIFVLTVCCNDFFLFLDRPYCIDFIDIIRVHFLIV